MAMGSGQDSLNQLVDIRHRRMHEMFFGTARDVMKESCLHGSTLWLNYKHVQAYRA